MAQQQFNTRIINKHDTESNWNRAELFIPKKGEIIIYDKDTQDSIVRIKIGDGITSVTKLPFLFTKVDTISNSMIDNVLK